MNKKLIRLTEQDLHRIVKESVNKVLCEGWSNYSDPQVNNYIRGQIGRTVMGIMNASQNYINNNDESALSQLYWLCSSFEKEYNEAWKNGNEIYGNMNFPQQQNTTTYN